MLEVLTDFEPAGIAIGARRLARPSELTLEGKFVGLGVFLCLCLCLCLEPPEDADATEALDFNKEGGPVVCDKE